MVKRKKRATSASGNGKKKRKKKKVGDNMNLEAVHEVECNYR